MFGAYDMASATQGKHPAAERIAPEVRMTEPTPTGSEKDSLLRFKISNLDVFYGPKQAVFGLNLNIPKSKITAFIGPSGCGKSTFLRTLNRMNETVRNSRVEGDILLDGENIFNLDVSEVRRRVGMVFQKSNPFPKSIFENVAYGPRINGYESRAVLRDRVEQSLRRAALWDEVKDKLNQSAYSLSGGQQQRLCIA